MLATRPSLTLSWAMQFIVLICLSIAGLARSDDLEIFYREAGAGHLVFGADNDCIVAPLLDTDVQLFITGTIARAKVRQRFANPSDRWVEATYIFPLPEDAAVDHMRMQIGERVIEGEIKETHEAKAIYKEAKQAGKRASLLTQERPNIFNTRVANIAPGAKIIVEIEYQQTVRYDQGEFSIRYPMTITPRFNPGRPILDDNQMAVRSGDGHESDTDLVPDASHITPIIGRQIENFNPIRIQVNLAPGFALEALMSVHHAVQQQNLSDGAVELLLARNTHMANRDFELRWSPRESTEPVVSYFKQARDGATYSYLMLMPPVSRQRLSSRTPRDLVFIIDTSGSMGGDPIRQAKRALGLAIERLQPEDRFNLIEFNNQTDLLFNREQPADTTAKTRAFSFVRSLEARGGTQMYPALDAALGSQDNTQGRVRQVIFMTDGAVGNEDQLFRLIKEKLGNSRLFTIGIGSAPNSHFMRKAAEFGRGTHTYIGDLSEVEERMGLLFRKLEAPALTDIKLNITKPKTRMNALEQFPKQLPDLYSDEPILFSLRTPTAPEGVRVRGLRGGKTWQATLQLEESQEREGIAVNWARQKIEDLMNHYLTNSDTIRKKEIQTEITELALAHHLVSRFTSLVAVDHTSVRPKEEALHKQRIKSNPPQGTRFGLAQTATDAELRVWLGLALSLFAIAYYRLCNLTFGQVRLEEA